MRKFGKILAVCLLLAGIALSAVSVISNLSYGSATGEIVSTATSEVGFDVHTVKYTVDGVELLGSRMSSGESIGDTITVYYEKSNPSTLVTPSTQLMPIAGAFLVLGVLFSILAFRKKKQ